MDIIDPVTIKLPDNLKFPLLFEFETSADSIVSAALPDFLKNIRPSGTLIASSPTPRDAVVGIDPVVKLLKCIMFCGIIYKYCTICVSTYFFTI